MVRAFGMSPKVGVRSPLTSRYFLSQTLWHFHKNTRLSKVNAVSSVVNISNVYFKMIIPPEPVFNNMVEQITIPPEPVFTKQCLGMIAQMVRAFGMSPKVGVRSPLTSRYFLSQTLWHFHKNTRLSKVNAVSSVVNISNVYFKMIIPPEPVFNNMVEQIFGPESSAWIRRLGVESPSDMSQNFDTFTRTAVRVSKMNAVSRAQLTFQMLTLLQNMLNMDHTYVWIHIEYELILIQVVAQMHVCPSRPFYLTRIFFRYVKSFEAVYI